MLLNSTNSDDFFFFIQKVHHPVQLPYDFGRFWNPRDPNSSPKTGYACPLMPLCCDPCALAPCNKSCSRQNRQRHLSDGMSFSCCLVSSMLLWWNQQWFLLFSMKKNKSWKTESALYWFCVQRLSGASGSWWQLHTTELWAIASPLMRWCRFHPISVEQPKIGLPAIAFVFPAGGLGTCQLHLWGLGYFEGYHELRGNCRSSICKLNL